MGISVNGPSGIDTSYIIDALTDLERNRVRAVEKERTAYQVKIDAYSKLKSLLLEIKTKASGLSKLSSFDLFTTSSSNEKIATIRGGAGAVDGSYGLNVFQIATNEKMASKDGLISSQSASLASMGITVGNISVDGITITIDDDDTIQDVRSKINSATDTKGNKINVSASVIKASDTNYRLVLTSKNTGSSGIAYKDLSGSTLQDLGIIANADGDKGSTNQSLRSAGDLSSAFSSLAIGETVQFGGTDRNGNIVSGTYVKSATGTIDDFFAAVKSTFNDMVDVSVDGTGNLLVSDLEGGPSKLSVSKMTVGAVEDPMSIAVVGEAGAGVLSVGKDAYFRVENIAMTSSSNSVSGSVTGVTFDLHSASAGETVSVSLSRDQEGIRNKFKEIIDAYNALNSFVRESTSVADPNNKDKKKGDLAGDMTVSSIVSQVRNSFRQQFNLAGGTYTNFTMVGLKTDTMNGNLTLDEEMFNKALEKGFDDVARLFTTFGVSDNANVNLGRSSSQTQTGKYLLEEVDGQHMRIRLEAESTWYTSDARIGDIVGFSSGPAIGLSLTAASGSIGAGSSVFTFSKGLSELIDGTITKLTDSREGLVSMRQESWRKSISRADERIISLESRVENYRLRLVKQFSEMEKALSNMQSQSNNLFSALGLYQKK